MLKKAISHSAAAIYGTVSGSLYTFAYLYFGLEQILDSLVNTLSEMASLFKLRTTKLFQALKATMRKADSSDFAPVLLPFNFIKWTLLTLPFAALLLTADLIISVLAFTAKALLALARTTLLTALSPFVGLIDGLIDGLENLSDRNLRKDLEKNLLPSLSLNLPSLAEGSRFTATLWDFFLADKINAPRGYQGEMNRGQGAIPPKAPRGAGLDEQNELLLSSAAVIYNLNANEKQASHKDHRKHSVSEMAHAAGEHHPHVHVHYHPHVHPHAHVHANIHPLPHVHQHANLHHLPHAHHFHHTPDYSHAVMHHHVPDMNHIQPMHIL